MTLAKGLKEEYVLAQDNQSIIYKNEHVFYEIEVRSWKDRYLDSDGSISMNWIAWMVFSIPLGSIFFVGQLLQKSLLAIIPISIMVLPYLIIYIIDKYPMLYINNHGYHKPTLMQAIQLTMLRRYVKKKTKQQIEECRIREALIELQKAYDKK